MTLGYSPSENIETPHVKVQIFFSVKIVTQLRVTNQWNETEYSLE